MWGVSLTDKLFLISGGNGPDLIVTDRDIANHVATALGATVKEVAVNHIPNHVSEYMWSIGYSRDLFKGLSK